ncbi:MAG: anaerobic ribonucleoside-triphosphate reductase activating protein [Prevotella sp.]|uniref:anaerobic ribonucleoside-triphosphate reductase activating protein n=1 Tax=Prevotella sp. TaxID=59823 RepID=UPI002A297190|nr:anaerobic ribonucleoside-triphosphate reductase activating protein [Prevotella sp.]MDD7318420.1 anaerobic ribonucleoside-triphosphate reductase activating protein [Prevotellaceae bacterium]MDY4020229.1 anaerobic ribonucleoside-triphosphate reductase activating protein [Prevotella sp.]
MLKYVNTGVVFQEIPDETTLSINISGCPNRCPGCHSRYLWEDIGTVLDTDTIDALVEEYHGDFTCVCFMGGDNDPQEVERLALYIRQRHPRFKVGWYSGKQYFPHHLDRNSFDYIKLGPYIAHLGSLKERTTNQRIYRKAAPNRFDDITERFWRKG